MMPPTMSCGISTDFSVLSPARGQVAHVLLTRLPLATHHPCGSRALARLACVRHAASVNPEPGSNSPSIWTGTQGLALSLSTLQSLSHSSVVKVLLPPPTLHQQVRSSLPARSRTTPASPAVHPLLRDVWTL